MVGAVNFIIYSIPVFFLLIGIELFIDKLRKTGYYRLQDAVSNINAGITEQLTAPFLKIFVIGLYVWIYDQYKLFEIQSNVISWLILFLAVDFFYYWFHRLAHEINFLWGGHVVHHQSEEYNLSVALRQGAFQKIGSFAFYLPLALIGFNPVMFFVVSQLQILYQFWIHTKTINLLPAPVEFLFNTPSHHRVHHGRNPKYLDKNHGGMLIIWDRMFGTFQKEEEAVVYGITTPLNTWNPLRAQLDFWKELAANFIITKKFVDKFKLLLFPPGWFPEDLGGPKIPPQINAASELKYETDIPLSLNYYVFIQFLIILTATSLFLFSYDVFDIYSKIIIVCFVIFSITSIGLILDLNPFGYFIEIFRMLLLVAFYQIMLQTKIIPDITSRDIYIIIFFTLISIGIFIPFQKYFFKKEIQTPAL
jgi:sterol desaturase/sphingolipid hydroxylase (fatty acid hydroxylase superfamily)